MAGYSVFNHDQYCNFNTRFESAKHLRIQLFASEQSRVTLCIGGNSTNVSSLKFSTIVASIFLGAFCQSLIFSYFDIFLYICYRGENFFGRGKSGNFPRNIICLRNDQQPQNFRIGRKFSLMLNK